MLKRLRLNKEIACFTACVTFALVMLVHLGRFSNMAFSADSVLIYQYSDRTWQLELGRWMHLVVWRLRGMLTAPYLVGVLGSCWLALAAVLIVHMLGLKRKTAIAAVCLLLTCNITLSWLAATYVHEFDVYMLSLLLACAGVYCWHTWRWGFLAAPGFLCISCALYQSYFQTAVVLCLMLLCLEAVEAGDVKRTFINGCKALFALLAGLLLYAISLKVIEKLTGVGNSTKGFGNGLGNMGGYASPAEVFSSLAENWLYPFTIYLNPKIHLPGVFRLVYALLLAFVPVGTLLLARRRKAAASAILLALAMIALMPIGMNCVRFISNGFTHELMIYSYWLLLALPVCLAERLAQDRENIVWRGGRMTAYALSLVLFFGNFVYGSQMFLRRELEYDATLSLVTRVIDRIEEEESFVPGDTPVAIVGMLNDSLLNMPHSGFEHLTDENNYAITSPTFMQYYIWQILGYPLNLISMWEQAEIENRQEVRDMPVFPAAGCVQWIDDVLVVKIGYLGGGTNGIAEE